MIEYQKKEDEEKVRAEHIKRNILKYSLAHTSINNAKKVGKQNELKFMNLTSSINLKSPTSNF